MILRTFINGKNLMSSFVISNSCSVQCPSTFHVTIISSITTDHFGVISNSITITIIRTIPIQINIIDLLMNKLRKISELLGNRNNTK